MIALPPRTPAECLAHCKSMIPDPEYRLALALIEALVAEERWLACRDVFDDGAYALKRRAHDTADAADLCATSIEELRQ